VLYKILELAFHIIIAVGVFGGAILIVMWVILPFMAWVVKKVLGE